MRVAIFLILLTVFSNFSGKPGKLEKELVSITEKAISEDYFSAASISAWKKGEKVLSIHKGVVNAKTSKKKATHKTLFDLASLTKPIVVLSLFFHLEKKKLIDRSWKISKFFPEIKRDITLFQLLTHTSGLPAYHDFFKMERKEKLSERKQLIVEYIASLNDIYPDSYSDVNYILLGFVIEKITGKDLDASFKEFISKTFPQIKSFTYNPLKNKAPLSKIAATSFSPPRNKVTQGEVEDENAAYLFGISGHAGLFGTADDVSLFYSLLLKDSFYRKIIIDQTGFDKKEGENSNYGTIADSKCSGHLGWTGTAFLICPKNDIVVTILTNRTHSSKFATTDMTNIKAFRQAVFDAVLSEFRK